MVKFNFEWFQCLSQKGKALNSFGVIFARQASSRFISSLFSLPVPSANFQGPKDDQTSFSSRSVVEYLEQGRVQKLLLFGLEGSGTSTLFEQVKFIHLLCWLPICLQYVSAFQILGIFGSVNTMNMSDYLIMTSNGIIFSAVFFFYSSGQHFGLPWGRGGSLKMFCF